LSKIKHSWQYRDEWAEYYWHPIFTAIKWIQHGLWYEDIIVLLLHDTIEDSDLTFEEIEMQFSRYVAEKVLFLSKKQNGKIIVSIEDYHTNLFNDPKSAVLKWFDRLANVFSLNFASPKRQESYIKDTKASIIPMIQKYDQNLAAEIQEVIDHIENPLYELPEELRLRLDDMEVNKI